MNVSHFLKICQVLTLFTNLFVGVSLILGHGVFGAGVAGVVFRDTPCSVMRFCHAMQIADWWQTLAFYQVGLRNSCPVIRNSYKWALHSGPNGKVKLLKPVDLYTRSKWTGSTGIAEGKTTISE